MLQADIHTGHNSMAVNCRAQGVPLRVEIGPKDLQQQQFVCVRRDTGAKMTYSLDDGVSMIQQQLELMHDDMFAK